MPVMLAAVRNSPMFHFTAVLPFPKTSQVAPKRGVMSLKLTPSLAGTQYELLPLN